MEVFALCGWHRNAEQIMLSEQQSHAWPARVKKEDIAERVKKLIPYLSTLAQNPSSSQMYQDALDRWVQYGRKQSVQPFGVFEAAQIWGRG